MIFDKICVANNFKNKISKKKPQQQNGLYFLKPCITIYAK